MPSTSAKQHRFMEGVAHGMKPRSGKGPSVAVAKDFVAADKGHKFGSGGKVRKRHKSRISPAMIAALSQPPPGPPPGPPAGLPMGGPPPGGPPPGMGMKRGGKVQLKHTKTENKGGQTKIGGGVERKAKTSTALIKMRGAGKAQKGTTPTRRYAKGGAVRGHGIETTGRTRGRFV
jgi:hypothetical protein